MINLKFDLVIIGAGGAGLMAAICAKKSGVKNIAVISKVFPTNSHTASAKGGINASLGNVAADDWKWHAFDTIKGSDNLADGDAVEILCKESASVVTFLEKIGVVFSRDEKGRIAQRAYGGQTTNFGDGGVAHRACYSKDKTGHTMLHSLYQEAIKNDVKFFNEFFVSDLLIENNQCGGCAAIDINKGEFVIFESKALIIASGGYSQIYKNTTSSLICTGEGSALILQENLQLQDMEFIQFHPTGIFGQGFLITEAARSEGAYLLNSQGDRFMKNYSPKMMELSSRDVISQSMATEVYEGRGCGKEKNYLHLDMRSIPEEVMNKKLPGVLELVKNFTKLDPKKDLIPVSPSAHYTMGGIPVNLNCEVISDGEVIAGLMAVGEAACVSVHGANRLGCNSLLDLIVFGKIAGENSKNYLDKPAQIKASKIAERKIKNFEKIFSNEKSASLSSLKNELQKNNEENLGVFRSRDLLEAGLKKTKDLFEIFKKIKISNSSLMWNEELIEYLELKSLFLNSLAANFSALNREESRGAHYRSDFKAHNDEKFFCHSLVKIKDAQKNELEFSTKNVRINSSLQNKKF